MRLEGQIGKSNHCEIVNCLLTHTIGKKGHCVILERRPSSMEDYQKQTFRFLDIDEEELLSIKVDALDQHESSVSNEIISLSLTTDMTNTNDNIIGRITEVDNNAMVDTSRQNQSAINQADDIESNAIEPQQDNTTRESFHEMKISNSCPPVIRDVSQREVIEHDYSIAPFHISVLTSSAPIMMQPSQQGGVMGLDDICNDGDRVEIFSLWPAFVAMGFTLLFVACCVFVVTYHASN
eukprot:scaffold2548_cov163-Ochromonas_danica.AAC.7